MGAILPGMSPAQILHVLIFATIQVMVVMVYALQTPFYPAEAEKKGLTTLEYGLVFGSFELFTVVFGPILDKTTNYLPQRVIFLLGTITLATSTCCFGFLDRVTGRWAFFSLSICLRLLEALGATILIVMSNAVVFKEFPARVATAAAIMEIAAGVGTSISPTIGGILFQVGGFTLPFLVLGSTVFFVAGLATLLMPKVSADAKEADGDEKRPNLLGVLKLPSVLLGYSTLLLANVCLSGMLTILEPYVRKFHLLPSHVGLMFLAYTGTYTIFGIAFGVICDRIPRVACVTLFGVTVSAVGYSCTGPLASFWGQSGLPVIGLGLFLTGIGISATYIPAMLQIVGGLKTEYPDASFVYVIASGLFFSAFSSGSFLGPILSGGIVDIFAVPDVFYFFIAVNILLVVTYIHVVTVGMDQAETTSTNTEETTSLLKSSTTKLDIQLPLPSSP